jgi:hypothetical protein
MASTPADEVFRGRRAAHIGVRHKKVAQLSRHGREGLKTAPTWGNACALGGTRTPNLLIRNQMLYPLSYERLFN